MTFLYGGGEGGGGGGAVCLFYLWHEHEGSGVGIWGPRTEHHNLVDLHRSLGVEELAKEVRERIAVHLAWSHHTRKSCERIERISFLSI